MSVWAVTMVRDEVDILPHTIAYLVAGQVNGLIIADNRSDDGTRMMLEMQGRNYQKRGVAFIVLDDPEIGYHQSRKMTALVHRAFDEGADWVIPFDADEIWYTTRPSGTLAHEIERQHPLDVLTVPRHNYFPTNRDPQSALSPIERITYRDPKPVPLPKVIVHKDPGLVIAQGNHDAVSSRPLRRGGAAIEVAHYPWRRYGQFERKVRNRCEAYQATDLPPEVGSHWRGYGEILETHGQTALRDIYYQRFHDPPMVLQHYPVAEANRGVPVANFPYRPMEEFQI